MESPIIDIIIPNRNKAAFLPATLASLANQTESRWRAIVIDGDSSDGSWEILQAAAANDKRFILKTARPASVTGLSIYRSWNHGLLQVRAPYFAILTSDDLWEPDWLKRAINGLETHPTAIATVARAIAINEGGEIIGPTFACRQLEESLAVTKSGMTLLRSEVCLIRSLLFGPIFSTIHSLVFRRKILEEGILFSEDIGYLADIEYYLNTSLLGDILYDFNSQALFRIYAGQASSDAKGSSITKLWEIVIRRNRGIVAKKLGISLDELKPITDDVVARHQFIMTKPDARTLRNAKLLAGWRMLRACFESPRLTFHYLACRGSKEVFLHQAAINQCRQLSAKYAA